MKVSELTWRRLNDWSWRESQTLVNPMTGALYEITEWDKFSDKGENSIVEPYKWALIPVMPSGGTLRRSDQPGRMPIRSLLELACVIGPLQPYNP